MFADTIFRHSEIRPLAYDTVRVEAIAVHAGRVVRMGTFEDMRELLGPSCKVIDLPGKVVQPAFHDAHIHLLHLHAHPGHISLGSVMSKAQMMEKIRQAVNKLSDESSWVVAWGLNTDFARKLFMESPGLLNEEFGDVRVIITTRDGHGAWLTKGAFDALDESTHVELQGMDRNVTTYGDDSVIIHITEQALGVVRQAVDDIENRPSGTLLRQRVYETLRLGVVCCHEAMVESEDIPMLEEFFAENPIQVTGRMHGMMHARAGQWAWLKERKAEWGRFDGRLSLGTVKAFLDGSLGSGTAWMSPQQDPPAMDPEELKEIAQFCVDEGFQLAVHAIGRQAVREALDVMESVRPATPGPYHSKTPLWRIEHAEFVEAADIHRAAHLGIVLSVQPLHLPLDAPILKARYREHLQVAFPWTDFTDAGVPLALGSDAPVTDCRPLANLQVACGPARRDLFGAHDAPLLLHALSPDVALHAHTVGGAVAALGKLGTGTLMSQQPADFVVLDGDPLRASPETFEQINVLETWAGGVQIVQSELPSETVDIGQDD
ncbi:MAG: hypothetical protein CMH54_08660 [Myxococcales bacterium]|nr:hypothetical protein [Myxococcales bacterium]|tara:strand:+ start:2201 stop:3841 length:1641 start_codon:yes stop_codon:yes gene_type:complete